MKNLLLGCAVALGVAFAFNADAQLRVVAPNGDVGVNEANPQGTFQVTSRGAGTFPIWAQSSAGTRLFQVNQGGVGAGNFFIYDAADVRTIQFAGQGKFYISTPGNLGVDQNNPSVDFEIGTAAGGGGIAAKPGGGMWATTSDARTKRNVQNYTKGLETLMQIDLVSYQYNGKFGTPTHDKTYVGVLAQELQKVAPEMVNDATYNSATLEQTESKDYDASQYEEDFLMVDLSNLTYLLVNAAKEQQAQIESLQDRIAAVKSGISTTATTTTATQAPVVNTSALEVAYVKQNIPNPFSKNTNIEYGIPTRANNAQLVFTDVNGNQIKSVSIDHTGKGSVDVDVKGLAPGIYSYTLIVDGIARASKKMIIQ